MNKKVKSTLLLLLATVFVSIIINAFRIDMRFQSLFYQEGEWIYRNAQPWRFLYDYGNIPALILSIGGFLLLLLGYYVKKYIPYRKIAIYLILVMVIGPGLITNSILKEHWGRPRPRNVVEFSGRYEFEPVLVMDRTSKGKSFPCGHATVGFYFFALYFLLRQKKKRIAFFFFWFAVLYGGIIGLARMVQGGHFFSDVIWAGVVVYLSAYWLFYLFHLDKSLYLVRRVELPKNSFKITVGILFGMFLLAGLVFLATPYEDEYERKVEISTPFQFHFKIENADVIVTSDSLFTLKISTFGHGFPGSKEKKSFRYNDEKDSLFFQQKTTGLFSELNSQIEMTFPESLFWTGTISLAKGIITVQELSNIKVITENAATLLNNEWIHESDGYLFERGERQIYLKTEASILLD